MGNGRTKLVVVLVDIFFSTKDFNGCIFRLFSCSFSFLAVLMNQEDER